MICINYHRAKNINNNNKDKNLKFYKTIPAKIHENIVENGEHNFATALKLGSWILVNFIP